MSVCCECCVLSGRGLCDELISRPEESYRLWCVVVCDLETSWMRRPWPSGGCCPPPQKKNYWKNKTIIPKIVCILQGHCPLVYSISTSSQKRRQSNNNNP